MNNIFNFHSVKTIGAVVGFAFLAVPVCAQGVKSNDSIATTQASKMPYLVKGRVVNASTGTGFAGVRITSPNLKVSAMTDEQGNYQIGLPDLKVNLYVEAPGFTKQVVAVKGRETVDITMWEGLGRGYYDDKLSVSAGEYNVEGFTSGTLSMTDDMTTLLNGQVRAVSQSGEPGSGASFFVRGYNSLNSHAQPLFVVDGVVWQMQESSMVSIIDDYYNNPLTLLDPSDIEKVTIMKNGTAIWGAKAANGVILIETKRGREMATKIDANISFGFQTPFKSLPMMEANAYKRYATDVMQGMDKEDIEKFQFTSDDPNKSYYRDTHNNTNWLDEINNTAMIQNYGISVSGGDDVALYRFSLGFAKNDGNIEGTSFNRLNMRFNSDIKITDNFNILADVSYAQTGHRLTFSGLNDVHSPYYLAMMKSPLYHPYQYNTNGSLSERLNDTDELNVGNPLALTEDVPDLDKYRFNLNVRPTYRITDRLELSALLGFSWDKANEETFMPNMGVSDVDLYNDQGEVVATALNEVRNLMARQSTLSVDAYLGWQILKDYRNSLGVKVGGRFYNDYFRYTAAQGYNSGSDYMTSLSNTNSDLRTLLGFEYKDRDAAWYLDADYNYMQKYFLNVAMSLETSSRFGSKAGGLNMCGVPWAFFPSISGAWLISSENFMKDVDFINNLKLRVAYSITGNSRLPLYGNRSYFTSNAFARDVAGLVLANVGNERLKWETTGRTNIGLDFSMFDNRWALHADAYFSKTKDLLTSKSMDDVSGVKYFWDNNGELTNKGFEIATDVRIVDMRDFKFNFGAMVGHYKNKITSLENGDFQTTICNGTVLTAVDNPVGVFYGYKTDGVFKTAQEASEAGLGIKADNGEKIMFEAGDMRFVDKDGDGIIGSEDRFVLGDPNPDFYGNFDLTFRYKQFELGALFTYSYGNEAYNAFRASLESGSNIFNQTQAMENRWVADGQNTDVPRATLGDPMGNARFSDRWIEDASYLKFKRLRLTYNIPFKSNYLQNISVWAAVNNLCTFSKYLGPDPEFSYGTSPLSQGIDAGLTPQSRSFQLGVNISL